MTTQKLETLMTGSEVFSSASIMDAFFSTAVRVDNIVGQVGRAGGRTAVLGDDTWGKLFGFGVEYPCTRSFDIWDWYSCDDIVYKHLLAEVRNRNSLTVGHFLALDHIGHASSSVSHPEFGVQKDKISRFIADVIREMDESQVLMVTGDHGMRDDGNHGGATTEEAESFLFVYDKGGKVYVLGKGGVD
jgi:phosphatidylinositol glycan class O